MNRIAKIIVLTLVLFSVESLAESTVTETKMILVKGTKSMLMDGDPFIHASKPLNYSKNKVLPFFLKSGWNIKSVHVNEKSVEDKLYGYVVIQKTKPQRK